MDKISQQRCFADMQIADQGCGFAVQQAIHNAADFFASADKMSRRKCFTVGKRILWHIVFLCVCFIAIKW